MSLELERFSPTKPQIKGLPSLETAFGWAHGYRMSIPATNTCLPRGYRSEFHLKRQSQIWIQGTCDWGTFKTTSMETAQLVGKKDHIFYGNRFRRRNLIEAV
jgi:hypothetical protein